MTNVRKLQLVLVVVTGLGLFGPSCYAPGLESVGLGKVVVYRNGVAYFERRAKVEGDELTLSVPRAKVDDFLKSLAVKDAATGKSLPVSFPSRNGAGSVVQIKIRLPKQRSSEVILTYVTDSPAWKPSYRLTFSKDGTLKLQGWAIVDNTSGEDWQDVLVGVGSSSALSFRYDLWSIRDVTRQTLAGDQTFAIAPPTGRSPYQDKKGTVSGKRGRNEVASVNGAAPTIDTKSTSQTVTLDQDYIQNMPAPGQTFEDSLGTAPGTDDDDLGVSFSGSTSLENQYAVDGVNTTSLTYGTAGAPVSNDFISPNGSIRQTARALGGSMARAPSGPSKAELEKQRKRRQLAVTQIRQDQREFLSLVEEMKANPDQTYLIESVASPSDFLRGKSMANAMRNRLISHGIQPKQLQTRQANAHEGQPASVRLVRAGGDESDNQVPQSPKGESHFESKSMVSVANNASAMVSIVNQDAPGNIVYLFDPDSERGNNNFAFKAVRFKNPTNSTLEYGPITVYGKDRFIGEGLTEAIAPGQMAMVPFALDRQILVESKVAASDKIAAVLAVQRGMVDTTMGRSRKTTFSIKNRLHKSATVYVKHTISEGWEIQEAPSKRERLGRAYYFSVEIPAGESKDLAVSEITPINRTLDLRASQDVDKLLGYLDKEKIHPKLAKDVKGLQKRIRTMRGHRDKILTLHAKLADYRVRADELHSQLFTLKAVKSSGKLMRHLRSKMADISERIQQNTIELVDRRDKIAIERVTYLDELAELSLDGVAAN